MHDVQQCLPACASIECQEKLVLSCALLPAIHLWSVCPYPQSCCSQSQLFPLLLLQYLQLSFSYHFYCSMAVIVLNHHGTRHRLLIPASSLINKSLQFPPPSLHAAG